MSLFARKIASITATICLSFGILTFSTGTANGRDLKTCHTDSFGGPSSLNRPFGLPNYGLIPDGTGFRIPGPSESFKRLGWHGCGANTGYGLGVEMQDIYGIFTENPDQLFPNWSSNTVSLTILTEPSGRHIWNFIALDLATGERINTTGFTSFLSSFADGEGGTMGGFGKHRYIVKINATPAQAEHIRNGKLAVIYTGMGDGLTWQVDYDQFPAVPRTYTATFDANGGSGTMNSQTSATSANIAANTFTRAGYTFTGWNTAADGSGTSFAEGANYNFASGNSTLYAQWSQNIAPKTPTELSVSNETFKTLDLTWKAPLGAISYKIFQNGVLIGTSTTPSFKVTGLAASTSYPFTVIAVNTWGESSPTDISTGTTATPAFTVNNIYEGTVRTVIGKDINFTATGFTESQLTSVTVSGAPEGVSLTKTCTPTCVYTLSGTPTNAGSFKAKVNATLEGGTVINRDITINIADAAPEATTNVMVSNITDRKASLSWDTTAGATSYSIYVNDVLSGTTTNTSHSLTGLTPETDYTVTVEPVNMVGATIGTKATLRTLPLQIPEPVADLEATKSTSNSIETSWTPVEGADGYRLYMVDTAGNTTLVKDITVGTADKYTVTGLTADTEYTFRIESYNSAGVSATADATADTKPEQLSLASTGIDLTVLVALASVLCAIGLLLIAYRRRRIV